MSSQVDTNPSDIWQRFNGQIAKPLLGLAIVETSVQIAKRLLLTSVVAIRAGFFYQQKTKPLPVLLRETFESLGTTYIKLGQFIASSPSLFPIDYVREFQQLLDRTTPVPFSQIEHVLNRTFGGSYTQLFSWVDPEPLASASIAQVHAAKLLSGEDVVIKVQKPGVSHILKTDLFVIHQTLRGIEQFFPQIKFASLADIAAEIRRRMLKELDFVSEMVNMRHFQLMLDKMDITQVMTPVAYPHASTNEVLTMQRLYGVPFVDPEQMLRYHADPGAAFRMAMDVWMHSVTDCESFHADLHAGNLLLLQDGRVAFIDFGIVGSLEPRVWQSCLQFMNAFQLLQYEAMAQAMVGMGMTHAIVDEGQLARDLEQLLNELMLGNPNDILPGADIGPDNSTNDLLLKMVSLGKQYGIHFPSDFALLMKQLLYFDRFIQQLVPDLQVFGDFSAAHRLS